MGRSRCGRHDVALHRRSTGFGGRRLGPSQCSGDLLVEARDGWDGEAVRALMAEDAVIDDFGVTRVGDFLPVAEFEAATEWRYLKPLCPATEIGPPAEVTCTNDAQRLGGVRGSIGRLLTRCWATTACGP